MSQTVIQPRLFHRKQAEGNSYWGPGDLYTWLVTGEESGGEYFSMLAIVPPQGGPPPHTHANEDETFYVLDGAPTFRLDDEFIVAGPGASSTCRRASCTTSQPLRQSAADDPRFHAGGDLEVLRGNARACLRPDAAVSG